MATDQTYRMPYPRSQVGHQMYDVRTQGLAIAQGHLPNLPHSATSAFRPAFVPQVPLQQRLVSPRVIPSNQEQYHQQRTVPFPNSGKHAVQLQLQQKQLELHQKQQQKQQQQLELHQKQQQHVFQTLQATIPANGFQELSMDVHQRAATNPAVQPAAPVQYPPITHQFSAAQGTSDHEILHQELRMLHAAHYQEKNRKDELLDAYMTQQLVEEKKQRIQTLDAQRKLLTNNNAVFRKKFFEETHTYVQQAQPMYLPKQEELYQARKARVPLGSAVPPTHPQMASYPHAHPETQVRLDGPMQHRVPQTVPQTRLVQAIKEGVPTANNFVGRPGNYQNFHLNQRFGVPQQYQPRGPGVMMPHQPVQYTHQEVFQSQRRQRDFPAQLQAANLIHSEVQHQPQKQPNFPLQYRQDIAACMMRDNIAQMPVTSHVGQVKQEQTMDIRAPMPGHMHSLPGQILRNRILENENKMSCTDNDSKESRRLSKMAVSIREEQMQLKEVLEKSLHRAAVQSVQKGVTENIRDSSSHIIAGSSCDNESMPRIIEVRSLANQESNGAVPGAHLNASKEAVLGISPGDVLGSNLKPSKPKSVMIKAHQELQEVPLNVNRVPSIGSLDSDNGRKDSWDSGIESPPWPENREACVMNMKRAASFPCDDMASLSIPHQSQKEKVVERKQSDNSIVNVGMDLSAKDQTNRADVLCNSLPEASNRNRQLSGDAGEKRSVSRGPVRLMNRKRSLPVDDVCPVEPKVLHCDPQALDYSKLSKEYVPEENIISKAGNSVKGQPATNMVVVDESPLDLSLKKDQQETSIEIEEMEEVQLDENEVTIEKKPNVDEIEEDEEEMDSKMKRGETCDGETKKATDEAANDANEMVIQSPENQMQGYFGTIMMRALKRLWSESKTKLEGEDAAKAKPEGVESSDEDSGKYFQPSSVTTLENVPRVDSPVGLPLSLEHESVKNMLSSSSSSHSLETALCELMQQSSDAFKHGGDIFKHFDKIIKRELMIEIGKRPLKCNDESTTTESKQEETPSVSESPDLNEVEPDEQTSEAVPLDSISPVNMLSEDEEIDDEIDDSQKLVIVENCLSPKPSPDSRETEREMEQETVPVPTSCAPQTSIAADSPLRKSFRSSRQMYEKAARDAAQKAAHEAARLAAQKGAQKAAQKAAQEALTMKESGISQAQGGQKCVGDVTDGMIISSEASLPLKQSPVPSPGQPNLKASMYPGAQGGPRINFHQLQNNRRAATAFVKQPQAPRTQRPQFMGKDIPNLVDVGEGARDGQSHACVERRYSEPATFNLNSTDSSPKDKLQRMMSDGSLSITPVKNSQTIAPSSKRPTARNTYQANPQTIWQAQAQENNDNKVKLVKVTYDKTIPDQLSPTLSGVPNAQDIQKHLQKSPIVLLPKLVFVPGQTFQQLTPVSGTQAFQPGNILLLHKDKRRSVSITTAPVLPTVSVQGPSNNAAPLRSSNSPLLRHAPEPAQSPDFIDTISGPFRIIRKTPVEHSSTKKPFISAFIIVYKNISLPGVLRSAVPFVPPRLLQNGMFPEETFENFCHALQDCNIMQRYMTVLERSALLNDLKHNKISSCKLVSLGEFHQKYDNIKELMQINKMT